MPLIVFKSSFLPARGAVKTVGLPSALAEFFADEAAGARFAEFAFLGAVAAALLDFLATVLGADFDSDLDTGAVAAVALFTSVTAGLVFARTLGLG